MLINKIRFDLKGFLEAQGSYCNAFHFLIFEYSRMFKFLNYCKVKKQRNSVFIWIPKTAGTSIFHVLSQYGNALKLLSLSSIKYHFPQKGIVTFGHFDYYKLINEGLISEKFKDSAFNFCFVRNPYTRTVSLFYYMKKIRALPADTSFTSFCRLLLGGQIEKIGLFNVKGLSQCNPQIRWVENVDIDFIGKMESVESDFNELLTMLELPKVELPHLNSIHHQLYSKYFNKETKQIVEKYYEEDFRYFGYPIGLI